MAKERPITEGTRDKILKNTGSADRPFYAMVGQIRRFRIFGILVWKNTNTSNFPEPLDKK